MLKRPSRLLLTAVFDHDLLCCKIMTKGDPDGYHYYAPNMDEYIRQLTAKLNAATDQLNAMNASRSNEPRCRCTAGKCGHIWSTDD
jgi:hypothetical protein